MWADIRQDSESALFRTLVSFVRRARTLWARLRAIADEVPQAWTTMAKIDDVKALEREMGNVIREEERLKREHARARAKLELAVRRFRSAQCPSRLAPYQWLS
jgi:hypothetical protein